MGEAKIGAQMYQHKENLGTCLQKPETSLHVLIECPAYDTSRTKLRKEITELGAAC